MILVKEKLYVLFMLIRAILSEFWEIETQP
jgi:hypothetical protein